MVQLGLVKPRDPHYECTHLRLDDPAYVFGRLTDPTARLAWTQRQIDVATARASEQ